MGRPINKRTLRRLAESGLTQKEIARRMQCRVGAVEMACSRMGIRMGSRGRIEANRRNARLAGPVNRLRPRIEAARLGWPQAGCRGDALLLEALHRSGPATLADILGRRPHSRDRARVTRLREAGLIFIVGKVKVPWACKPRQVLALAAGVRPPEPAHGQGR